MVIFIEISKKKLTTKYFVTEIMDIPEFVMKSIHL